MSDQVTEFSGKFTEAERREMSSVAEASILLEEIAEPSPPNRKVMFGRMVEAVTKYGGYALSFGRAEDLWRQEARRVDSEEMDAIRAAHRRHQEAKARAEAKRLAELYRGIATRLRQTDEEFHRPEIDRLEHAADALSALDRPRSESVAPVPSEGGRT